MKKTLFIAFAIAGLSQYSFAQQQDASSLKAAPTQAESDKATRDKLATKQESAVKSTNATTKQPGTAEYKKAGLNEQEIAAVNKANNFYDAKKADINNDSKLTAEEKKGQLAALEAERTASLQKRLGDDSYKKYSTVKPSVKAQAKKTAAPVAKPAN